MTAIQPATMTLERDLMPVSVHRGAKATGYARARVPPSRSADGNVAEGRKVPGDGEPL
jgi:hypothetical protein